MRPNPSARLRLFCFPYAGNGATIFRAWPRSLPDFVEVCPVQFPGRENRLQEPPFTRLTMLAQAAAHGLAPHLDKPFAFFGHSMGALVAFEVARCLRRTERPRPVRLFVSGAVSPSLRLSSPRFYDLPEAELLDELRRLEGTPPEVLAHPELMRLALPIIRADFEVCQTYEYPVEPPLDCPITAFGGLEDAETPREHVAAWQRETNSACETLMLPGGHFFIHTAAERLLRIIAQELRESVRPG